MKDIYTEDLMGDRHVLHVSYINLRPHGEKKFCIFDVKLFLWDISSEVQSVLLLLLLSSYLLSFGWFLSICSLLGPAVSLLHTSDWS